MNGFFLFFLYYAESATIDEKTPIKKNWNFFIIVVILYQIDSNKKHGGTNQSHAEGRQD